MWDGGAMVRERVDAKRGVIMPSTNVNMIIAAQPEIIQEELSKSIAIGLPHRIDYSRVNEDKNIKFRGMSDYLSADEDNKEKESNDEENDEEEKIGLPPVNLVWFKNVLSHTINTGLLRQQVDPNVDFKMFFQQDADATFGEVFTHIETKKKTSLELNIAKQYIE